MAAAQPDGAAEALVWGGLRLATLT
jgi:hypothetical protein